MANGDWRDEAACAGKDHLDWFDLDCGLEEALKICAVCPVGDECLDYAVKHHLVEGVWGGAWGDELIGIVRGRRPRGGVRARYP